MLSGHGNYCIEKLFPAPSGFKILFLPHSPADPTVFDEWTEESDGPPSEQSRSEAVGENGDIQH